MAAACTTAALRRSGLVYLTLEQVLMARTELFLFESRYGRDAFTRKIGTPRALVRVVHNGVTAEEFAEVASQADATDIVFIGELRMLKGVDVLLDAIAQLAREGRSLTATIVGDGPDAALFRAQAERLGLATSVRFPGAMPARAAFALGRLMVAPSRAEFAALHHPGDRRGRRPAGHHQCRRHPGGVRPAGRPPGRAGRFRRAGGGAARRARRPGSAA